MARQHDYSGLTKDEFIAAMEDPKICQACLTGDEPTKDNGLEVTEDCPKHGDTRCKTCGVRLEPREVEHCAHCKNILEDDGA